MSDYPNELVITDGVAQPGENPFLVVVDVLEHRDWTKHEIWAALCEAAREHAGVDRPC